MGLGPGQRRGGKDRVRLRDVAERVGVSQITVSRALRHPETVSRELRETILRCVEEMGYIPDLSARALARGHNDVVGVLSPGLSQQVFSGALVGIEERMRSTDFHLQYATVTFELGQELARTQAFLAQKPAGLILAGVEHYDSLAPLLAQATCPVAHIIDISQEPDTLAVGIDHYAAAAEATRYLLSRGYRRIGLIGGYPTLRTRRRMEGYEAVMSEAGLFDKALVLNRCEQSGVALGVEMLSQLVAAVPDLDAVFCQNDDVALGALFECQRRGIRVPEDFGICGYNDLEFASVIQPALTTVLVPRRMIGFRVADMLLRAIEGVGPPDPKIEFDFSLIRRSTTR